MIYLAKTAIRLVHIGLVKNFGLVKRLKVMRYSIASEARVWVWNRITFRSALLESLLSAIIPWKILW